MGGKCGNIFGVEFTEPVSPDTVMSYKAKATLAIAFTFCGGTVWAVHANQNAEREVR